MYLPFTRGEIAEIIRVGSVCVCCLVEEDGCCVFKNNYFLNKANGSFSLRDEINVGFAEMRKFKFLFFVMTSLPHRRRPAHLHRMEPASVGIVVFHCP